MSDKKPVRKKTRKTKLTSDFTDLGPVTPPQKLAEMMCDRQAKKAGKRLPDQFWNVPEWHDKFMLQLFRANQLLKKYPAEVIFAVLNKMHWVYSLLAKFLLEHFDKELAMLPKEKNLDIVEADVLPREKADAGKAGILSKLRELDDG